MAIPQTFDEAFERTKQLVSIFSENEGKYLSPGYSEAQARLDFIDKFWTALGWDVNHEDQLDPYKQEVKVERGVATSEFRKRADYAFLAPNFRDVRFFVEAKKPHAGIDNPTFYFQTIRYGWNNKTPLSVLTDFEEMRVLDCRYKPDISTALGHAVLKYHYADYADKEKFRTIYHLFSREAVLNGSIESFAKGMPKLSRKRAQRGVAADEHQSIDESFLQELDDFREELARAYKRKNPELDSAELTEVTQRTLDRLVFMRFLEDKLIESDPLIEDLHKKGKSWENFIATSRRLDRVYNGIIFKEHSLLDSDRFKADERVFDKISQSLSHRDSPYDFNAIPIHILGSIYERFLGKVIIATAKQARVEDKPEVRKAGGVYYTPEYIVRYIVDNTVGKLIEGKTSAQIQEMRFADIACGSGSFLLDVYDTLLRYHAAYYNRTKRNRDAGIKAGCIQRPDGTLQLSLLQKRQILLNNIYGVDIDPQAVEVAQLSLYLKLLEDETIASAHTQQLVMKEALLPSLSKNIVCGNSLIGWDILEGKLFDSGEERKLNPMNFEDAFPEIMKRGGFEVIVGNPPWISLSGKFRNEVYPQTALDYLIHRFRGNTYMPNMYEYFIAQGLSIVRNGGYFSLIVPDRFGFNNQFVNLRRHMLEESRVLSILYRAPFPKVVADTLVFVVQRGEADHDHAVEISEYKKSTFTRTQGELLRDPNHLFEYFEDPKLAQLIAKIDQSIGTTQLNQICETTSGFGGKSELITETKIHEKQIPTIKGESIGRYEFRKNYWFEFKPENITGRTTDRRKLGARDKVLLRKTGNQIIATYDESGIYPEQSLYFLFGNRTELSFKFLLGVLNSRLLNMYYATKSLTNRASIAQVKKVDLDRLPIPVVNLSLSMDKAKHDRIVQLVDQMLEAKKQLAAARSEGDQNFYESKCATLDRQIDQLVYELYELTPEETDVVEKG